MIVRITEAEFASDVHGALEKVRRGDEVIIEREDHHPLAVMKQLRRPGRDILECIEMAKAYERESGFVPFADPDFANDVEEFVNSHREPIRNLWDE